MNQFQKSQAEKIRSCYETTELEKGGVGSGRHKIHATIDVVRDSSKFPHQTVGITSSGKHVSVKGKFIDKKSKMIVQPDDADKSEANEMWSHHHDRLTGGSVKDELKNRLKKSEDDSLEKGGVGSGKYNHLHGHQFIHQRQRHTIKKIDDSGVLHTKEGKMFRMSTLQDNGVEFPDKQPTVRAPRPLDMLDYKIRLTELEQEKKKVFRDQENDPEIELEGGRVANSYGTKLNAIDKKIEQLNQKYGVSKNSNEYMTYEEINKISSTFK